MQNKKNIILVAGFVVVAIVFFFIGSNYANSKNNSTNGNQQTANNPGNRGAGQRGGRGGGVFGKVVAKDATSITVELSTPMQGADTTSTGTGSKIVFYTDQTTITKTATGSIGDIVVGSNVSVNGQANTDGSVNAQTISLRPNMPTPPKQ